MLNVALVFGQSADAATFLPTIRVSEACTKLVLAAAVGGRNRRQTQEDAAILQIGPTDEVADPAQEHGALGVNEAPIVVGEESAAGDGPSEDKLAKGV